MCVAAVRLIMHKQVTALREIHAAGDTLWGLALPFPVPK